MLGITMDERASQFQIELAGRLNIEIDRSSFLVASAQIEDAIALALWREPRLGLASERQVAYAASFGLDVAADSKRVASAKIEQKQLERSRKLISEMNLEPGIEVWWRQRERKMVISSIAANGRLWFKGGNGQGAFPHEVDVL